MFPRRTILPHRALRLSTRHLVGAFFSGLLVLACGVGFGACSAWTIADVVHLQREKAVWARGVPADGEVKGTEHSKLGLSWVIAIDDLDVAYTSADGQRHTGNLEFMTFLGGPDTDAEPELRYDPAHPDDFALSWGIDGSGARWRAGVIVGGLAGIIALFILYAVAIAGPRRQRLLRQCARDGEEVIVRIADIKVVKDQKGNPTPNRIFTVVPPAATGGDDPPIDSEAINASKHVPLFADAAGHTAFALYLRGKERQLILLTDGFAPLDLTDAEKAEAVRRAEARRTPR
jgi:hypothetical protein